MRGWDALEPSIRAIAAAAGGSFTLGVVAYLGTGRESLTALIPSALGVLLALSAATTALGRRRLGLGSAIAVGVTGVAASARGVLGLVRALGAGAAPSAPQLVQMVLCVGLLVLVSYLAVRAQRARSGVSV